ncbi:MAG: BRO family protein, partial [Methanosarcinales archaeon]
NMNTEIIKTDYFRKKRVDVVVIGGVEYFVVDQIARALEYKKVKRLYLNINDRWISDFENDEIKKVPKPIAMSVLDTDIGLNEYSYVLLVNKQGLLKIIAHARKNAEPFLSFLKSTGCLSDEVIMINNIKEIKFKEFLEHVLDGITKVLHLFKIEIKEEKYIIDFYLPEFNIAIEFDEYYHKEKVNYDDKRQQEITDYLMCDFIRVEEKEDYGIAINKILKAILNRSSIQVGIDRW